MTIGFPKVKWLHLAGEVDSALEVFINDMRYINPRFTYLLTYLLIYKLFMSNFIRI